MKLKAFSVCILVLLLASTPRFVRAQEEPPDDPVLTVLIPLDLRDAVSSMQLYDRNGDGSVDRDEQQRLKWPAEAIKRFDLNRDERLAHLEIALRHAEARIKDGIIEIDSKFAEKYMGRNDINKNGQLDAFETAEQNWPPDVAEYDKNSDGVISMRELLVELAFRRRLRKELGIMGVDAGGANKLLNRFDRNSDGKLDADEAADADLPRSIKDFDRDDDGKLAVMEIAEMLAKNRIDTGLTASDQFQARSLIALLDKDRDGVVSELELKADGAKNLAKLDLNKDGEISLAEAEKHAASERKRKGYSDRHEAAARRLMSRHDKNRDGALVKGELLEKAGPGELSVDQLSTIDLDQDGKIVIEELAKYLSKQDAN